MKREWLAAALLFAAALPFAPSARAQVPGYGDALGLSPFWDWRTIETDHFRLTYPAELKDTARKAGGYFEQAYARLTEKLQWQPWHKTQILLIDNADAANGLTSAVARFGIVLYVTPPDNWFSTAYYEDWLQLLCVHEFTHLVNMDTATGVWQGLRYIFGDVFLPNSIWPTWMLEGLAVYEETLNTPSGRGRSPYYEMILRAAVEGDALDSSRFMTIDRVRDANPYFPGGEIPYMFGYELMNQVSHDGSIHGRTHDGDDPVSSGDDALGLMSKRSGGRVPFFINGNLENITGKEWYGYWDAWVAESRARMRKELAQIRSKPVTKVERLTEKGYGALGAAVSPDGHWLAYTQSSLDRRSGLYIRDLKTGETRRAGDKELGVGHAFTPDSGTAIFSAGRKDSNYYLWSDLEAYDVEGHDMYWLTNGLRARDPDVSRDGKRVAFTIAENASTVLAEAPLSRDGSRWKVGTPKRLYVPARYDNVATPKYSPDGKKIYFSVHRNGKLGEDLYEYDTSTGSARALVSNGAFNRFPAVDSRGWVYFVSDMSGVDNLYLLEGGRPRAVTNVTTGLWLPAVGPGPKDVYASVLSINGWDLARIELTQTMDVPKVEAAPAPKFEPLAPAPKTEAPETGYSVIPSIWPRQWTPIWLSDSYTNVLGAEVLGWDATDRHRYVLAALYDTETRRPDGYALYSNRQLGPTISLLFRDQNADTFRGTNAVFLGERRERELGLDVSFPFQWTYSSLELSAGADVTRQYVINPDAVGQVGLDQYVPDANASFAFSHLESSRLAISTERGGSVTGVGRAFQLSPERRIYRGTLNATGYLPVTTHSVLVASAAGSESSDFDSAFTDADVKVDGQSSGFRFIGLGKGFDSIVIRGYPNDVFYVRRAAQASLDYRFPIFRIFRGWGTNPAFLEDLFAFGFGESTWMPELQSTPLTSAGGGLRLSTELFERFPITFSGEYQYGFDPRFGKKGNFVFGLLFGNFEF